MNVDRIENDKEENEQNGALESQRRNETQDFMVRSCPHFHSYQIDLLLKDRNQQKASPSVYLFYHV